jgi:hypothetical protein
MTEYHSPFYEKLSSYKTPIVTNSICCWTDLLGFGRAIYQAKWEPSETVWMSIFKRITEAHHDCYQRLDLLTEFVLTLNDGIVRCCNLANIEHIQQLSMWLRECVLTHNRINERERAQHLPGARTVLAHGKKLIHGPSELTFEDFVLNYTKPDPNGPSSLPRTLAQRVVALNPEPLQLNLAFSKAYILDRLGSRGGISGGHFYIDESVFHALTRCASTQLHTRAPIDREEGARRLFAIPRQDDQSYHLGFHLELPRVSISTAEIETSVYRAMEFYPCDEPLPFTLPVV